MAGNQGDLNAKHQHKSIRSNLMGRVNRLLMSKEHRNVLAGWIKLGNVKEPLEK